MLVGTVGGTKVLTPIFAFDNKWFHMQIINFEIIMYKFILCEEMQAFVCLFSFSKQCFTGTLKKNVD